MMRLAMKPNWLSDARLIPDEVMSYLRKIAVHAVEENHYSPEDVIKIFGFSRSVIYDWLKRYQKDGYAGLDTKKAPGVSPMVTEEMDVWLKQTILDSTPEDFGYDTILWTCDLLAELLSNRYGVQVIGSTVNHHLHRLGLTNQTPNYIPREQDPVAIERFVKEQFHKIQSLAKKVGAEIGFEDEAAVDLRDHSGKTWGERGVRPDVYVTGQRGRLNILSVVTAQGTFDYQVTEQRINSKEYIEFLEKLIKDRACSIFLVVDRAPFHCSKQVRTFIWHHRRKIRLFYLPTYSPELNPDEHAWEEIKDKQLGRKSIKNKRDLKEHLQCALASLKDRADRIISFFHLPETQYAAAQ
jgi:transposase